MASYVKQTWADGSVGGTPIDAASLNYIEDGIDTLADSVTAVEGDVSTLEGNVSTLSGNVSTLSGDVTAVEGDITALEGDVATVTANKMDKEVGVMGRWRGILEEHPSTDLQNGDIWALWQDA